jgi:hypothetical protein
VLLVQFTPSVEEQTSTAFPGLLAMNATQSRLLNTATPYGASITDQHRWRHTAQAGRLPTNYKLSDTRGSTLI